MIFIYPTWRNCWLIVNILLTISPHFLIHDIHIKNYKFTFVIWFWTVLFTTNQRKFQWKKKENNIFSYIFFWSLKFCTFWYIIQLVNMVDLFVEKCWPSNFQTSNPQILSYLHGQMSKNIILSVAESSVLFSNQNYFQKMKNFKIIIFWKKKNFSGVSRIINFNFLSMLLLWKCPLRLVDNV